MATATIYLPIWSLPLAGWICLVACVAAVDARDRRRRRRARARIRRRQALERISGDLR